MPITITCERSEAFAANHKLPQAEERSLGPFAWVQLTENALRVAPNGDEIAFFDTLKMAWVLEDDESLWSDIVLGELTIVS